jgi:RNA polymerase sigma-70 factor (ECF subfamily)
VRLVGRKGAKPIDNADHFVFRAAANLLRDRARRAVTSHRAQHVSLSEPGQFEGDADLPSALVEDRAPDRVLIGKERLGEVLDRLDDLGERTRTIFILFRIERMKQREIAQRLGVAVPTVEKHVIRAVAHLTRCFEDDLGDGR